jgi:3-phosphoshikimate 1-carboxyvinyltransferase
MLAMQTSNPYRIKKSPPLNGEIKVPGDKSISHRAVLLSSLSNGRCEITNFLPGEDCRATIGIMRALGVEIEEKDDVTLIVHGCRGKFQPPNNDLYCGNSGTTMRLVAGLLSTQPFRSRLTGDESLSKRPMTRIMIPLQQMGANLTAEKDGKYPPLAIEGGVLQGIDYTMPMASAQVKSAILLAGLFAKGRTRVIEPAPCRDHTERMLRYFLVPVRSEEGTITLHGGNIPESRDFAVPGDISSAAFWLVAAAARPGSWLRITNVGLNPTRSGILSVLIRMGANIRESVDSGHDAEPSGSIEISGRSLRATRIEGAEIANVIDELPILAVAAALAEGTTVIADAAELRVKETDRLAALANNLRLMGVTVRENPDGLEIEGGRPLRGAILPSFGDHRIAMSFAIAGLFAKGETIITGTECVDTSYPGFAKALAAAQRGLGS